MRTSRLLAPRGKFLTREACIRTNCWAHFLQQLLPFCLPVLAVRCRLRFLRPGEHARVPAAHEALPFSKQDEAGRTMVTPWTPAYNRANAQEQHTSPKPTHQGAAHDSASLPQDLRQITRWWVRNLQQPSAH